MFNKKDQGIIKRTENSIAFYVDGNLPLKENDLTLDDAKAVESKIIGDQFHQWQCDPAIYSSFRGKSLYYPGQDVLYKCFAQAYAEHHPLTLSPDMIWLIICQGFSHYINNYAEKYRHLFVEHSGKVSLCVRTNDDLFSENVDWTKIMKSFSGEITKNSNQSIVENLVADFTTTGEVEFIASQITVMDVLKEYFEYIVFRCICGIPYITLEGTPEDWESILNRLSYLRKFDLDWWVDKLEPVIREFVAASKGKVNTKFWRDIVRKRKGSVDIVRG